MSSENRDIMPLVHKIILPTAILILTIIYYFDIFSLPNKDDKLMIEPVIWIMFILYPIIIFQEIKQFKKNGKTTQEIIEEEVIDETEVTLSKKVLIFMISTFIYLILMHYIGFILSTFIYMPFILYTLGTKSKVKIIILTIIFTLIVYYLFNFMLDIPMPNGFFEGGF